MVTKYEQMISTYNTYNLLWNQLQEQIARKKHYLDEYKEQVKYYRKVFFLSEETKNSQEIEINEILKAKGLQEVRTTSIGQLQYHHRQSKIIFDTHTGMEFLMKVFLSMATGQLRLSHALMLVHEATNHTVVPEKLNQLNHEIVIGVNNSTSGQIFIPYKRDLLSVMTSDEYLNFFDYKLFIDLYDEIFGEDATASNRFLWKWLVYNNKIIH